MPRIPNHGSNQLTNWIRRATWRYPHVVVRPGTSVGDVRRRLRDDILSGRIQPGSSLSQVHLAERYGVSRTPLREALRLLQEEGLVAAAHTGRARVRDFDLNDVEAISAQRIMLAALATYVTVSSPGWQAEAAPALTAALDELDLAANAADNDAWREADLAFHTVHTERAPSLMLQDLSRLGQRNELYKTIWMRTDRYADLQTVAEHQAILAACVEGDARSAMCGIARHQARIAITVMARSVPEREPATIRAALQIVLGRADSLDGSAVTGLAPAAGGPGAAAS